MSKANNISYSINLDDDNEVTVSPTVLKTIERPKITKSSPSKLRVKNFATESNIKAVSSSSSTNSPQLPLASSSPLVPNTSTTPIQSTQIANRQANRRKSNHKVLPSDDISFTTSVFKGAVELKKFKKLGGSPSATGTSVNQTINLSIPLQLAPTIENPNSEFIQRVAFLRGCINYMLATANEEQIDFEYGNVTLSKLISNYQHNLNDASEEIVLSD